MTALQFLLGSYGKVLNVLRRGFIQGNTIGTVVQKLFLDFSPHERVARNSRRFAPLSCGENQEKRNIKKTLWDQGIL